MFYKSERTALFVDGKSLYHSCYQLGFKVDYSKLHHIFAQRSQLVSANYFHTVTDNGPDTHQKTIDWMKYNSWNAYTSFAPKTEHEDGTVRQFETVKMEIAMKVVELLEDFDHAIIVSGDVCFAPLVQLLKTRCRRSTIISTVKTTPIAASPKLRKEADHFVDLDDIASEIAVAELDQTGS